MVGAGQALVLLPPRDQRNPEPPPGCCACASRSHPGSWAMCGTPAFPVWLLLQRNLCSTCFTWCFLSKIKSDSSSFLFDFRGAAGKLSRLGLAACWHCLFFDGSFCDSRGWRGLEKLAQNISILSQVAGQPNGSLLLPPADHGPAWSTRTDPLLMEKISSLQSAAKEQQQLK